jgi:hypothetical protein
MGAELRPDLTTFSSFKLDKHYEHRRSSCARSREHRPRVFSRNGDTRCSSAAASLTHSKIDDKSNPFDRAAMSVIGLAVMESGGWAVGHTISGIPRDGFQLRDTTEVAWMRPSLSFGFGSEWSSTVRPNRVVFVTLPLNTLPFTNQRSTFGRAP